MGVSYFTEHMCICFTEHMCIGFTVHMCMYHILQSAYVHVPNTFQCMCMCHILHNAYVHVPNHSNSVIVQCQVNKSSYKLQTIFAESHLLVWEA